ncbi:MAG: site-specific DNA-methyltransferase [Nitrospirae bacterium]|nr:site-specific DNA-methyltransferase [Nitrospirota bacterium]
MTIQQFSKNVNADNINALEFMDREDLLVMVKAMMGSGIAINFHGKRTAQEIDKKVRPRQTLIKKDLSVGTPEQQARNTIIEGENLQAMVTLYKERGQVDLIVTDPPYNTGGQFRYNDKWDTDPNDPELGQLVKMEDGSRHTKWMKAMLPRLNMMYAMLKPNGVLAICIDDNELFHLGMMLDEIFGEYNRIGIINWQKAYSPKNQDRHISTATEYVLVYAKDKDIAKTALLERDEEMNARYWNPDNDLDGVWKKQGDPSAKDPLAGAIYAIQSPFTGTIYYPPQGRHWSHTRAQMRKWLKEWALYDERDIGDGNGQAILITGYDYKQPDSPSSQKALAAARYTAEYRLKKNNWPKLHFGENGTSGPNLKRNLKFVKKGKLALTYWADDDYDEPIVLGAQSWEHGESGHSQTGINELDAIIGRGHGFTTVKPLKLIKKIIQLWCPPNGLVLDPYAGSGTTGHAVLELNAETGAARRFIMIEQGAPERGDKYARSLTQKRLCNAITGERPTAYGKLKKLATPLQGGFEFRMLTKKIDSKTVLTMRKDELIDLVITSHWENGRRGVCGLIRMEQTGYKYLVGRNEQGEGYFLIWNGSDKVGQLDQTSYVTVVAEAKRANLKQPYHVYARYEIYQSRNVVFYKIPDKILAHLGLNENSDSFNEGEE